MCFSAPVSLAASALLLPVGLYSLRIAYQYETRLIFDPWISQQWARLLYALIVLIPFGLSPSPLLKLMGGAVGLSAILSNWLLHEVFISTWCFFAAVLSLGVLYVCRTAPSSGQNLPCITPGVGVQLRDG